MKTIDKLIEDIIDGEAMKAPLFTLAYEDRIHGRRGEVRHAAASIIYSEFDTRMSRHMHVTGAAAFPTIEVTTGFRPADGSDEPRTSTGVAPTILDALIGIGESATRGRDSVEISLGYGGAAPGNGDGGDGARRIVFDRDMLDAIRIARQALHATADPVMCRVSSDLLGATVFLPGSEDAVLFEADFTRAMLTVPARGLDADQAIRVPLFNFERECSETPALVARMRVVRDMLMRSRKQAVDDFCRYAEREVTEIDLSLRDRRLTGFRREIAQDLVGRLKLAFGDGLRGLSPHARLLAFDWAAGDDEPPEDGPASDRLVTAGRPVAAE